MVETQLVKELMARFEGKGPWTFLIVTGPPKPDQFTVTTYDLLPVVKKYPVILKLEYLSKGEVNLDDGRSKPTEVIEGS